MNNIFRTAKLISFPFLIALLFGCSTGKSGETILGRPGSKVWFNTASLQTQISYFTEICRKYGFLPSTNELAQCIQKETIAAKSRIQNLSSNSNTLYNSNNDDVKRRIRDLEWDSQMKEVNSNLDKLMRR